MKKKKKRRPRKSKFQIPGRKKENKVEEIEIMVDSILRDHYGDEMYEQIELCNAFTSAALRDFYNSIVEEDQRISSDSAFCKIPKELTSNDFYKETGFAEDFLFGFLGYKRNSETYAAISSLIKKSNHDLIKLLVSPSYQSVLNYLTFEGHTPLKRQVLCLVQEVPTIDFIDRDEILINPNSREFKQWAGEEADKLSKILKTSLNIDRIKVINKLNNPKAYKNYLRLKQIAEKKEELGIEEFLRQTVQNANDQHETFL